MRELYPLLGQQQLDSNERKDPRLKKKVKIIQWIWSSLPIVRIYLIYLFSPQSQLVHIEGQFTTKKLIYVRLFSFVRLGYIQFTHWVPPLSGSCVNAGCLCIGLSFFLGFFFFYLWNGINQFHQSTLRNFDQRTFTIVINHEQLYNTTPFFSWAVTQLPKSNNSCKFH